MNFWKSEKGLTIVELTIASGIIFLVAVGMIGFYALSERGLRIAHQQVSVQRDAEMIMYALTKKIQKAPAGAVGIADNNHITGRKLRVGKEEYFFEGYEYVDGKLVVVNNPTCKDDEKDKFYYRLKYRANILDPACSYRILVGGIKKIYKTSDKFYPLFEIEKLYKENALNVRKTRWIPLNSLPARSNFGYGLVEGAIYVIGGTTGGVREDEVWKFDLSTESWEKVLDGSTIIPLAGAAACTYEGKIYLFGGEDAFLSATTTIMCYDPATNTLTDNTPLGRLPVATAYAGACLVNLGNDIEPVYRIYVIGGLNSGGPQEEVMAYDFTENRWLTDTTQPGGILAPIPAGYGVGKIKAVPVFNHIFIFSGEKENNFFQSALLIFAPKANSNRGEWWVFEGEGYFPPQAARAGYGACTYNEKLFVLGGYNQNGITPRIDIACPYLAEDALKIDWFVGFNEGFSARCYLAAICAESTIYAIGGENGTAEVGEVEVFDVYRHKKVAIKFNVMKEINVPGREKPAYQEIRISSKVKTRN